jgi:hypothetical protein
MTVWRAAEAALDTFSELDMEDMGFIGPGTSRQTYGNDRAQTLFAILSLFN